MIDVRVAGLAGLVVLSLIACGEGGDDNDDADSDTDSNTVGDTDSDTAGLDPPIEYGGHTYYLSRAQMTWQEASSLAQESGGYLVTVNDQAENDFVRDSYRSHLEEGADILWLGNNDIAVEGQWVWENGEQVGYENWHVGEPNDEGGQDCGHMWYMDGTWDDTVCTYALFALVEVENQGK